MADYKQHLPRIAHLDSDAIPTGTCLSCGLVGKHGKPVECIGALRQHIVDLEIRVNTAERAKAALDAKLALT